MAVSVSNSLSRIITSGIEPKERALEASIKRLATGERIHKGADDAASMHTGSRLESQIRGLTVTVARQKDTLNDLYTAEGAISKIGELLQRLRELALNSQSDTIDNSQRKLINAEADTTKQEIDRIANSTQANGVNLLDGSYVRKSLQMSPTALDTMDLNISSIRADNMIFIRDDLTMRMDSTPYIIGYDETSLQTSNANKIASGSIYIDGHLDFGYINVTAGMTAKQFASAIGSAGFGIDASAVTKGELFGMANPSGLSFRLGASSAAESAASSGQLISATITDVNDLSPLVTAINDKYDASTISVSAEIANGGSSVILTDPNGNDIFISHMDFSPEGLYVSNNAGANQNLIYARVLDRDGIRADVANENLSRGVGTDETVLFIDKHRHQHIDEKEGVISVTTTYGGSGYASAPTVTFSGGGNAADAAGNAGASASYSANLTNGAVSSITRANDAARGKGYDTMPTVTLSAPPTQNFNARTAFNMSNDQITLANHNFETNDKVYYGNGGGLDLSGLSNGNTYYVRKIDSNTIQLALAANGAAINIQPRAQSFNTRTNVNISTDAISVSNHPLSNGERVTYTNGGRSLRNLSSGSDYLVRDVSGSTFKLKDLSGNNIDLLGMVDSLNAQTNVSHSTNRMTISGHNLTYNDKVTYSTNSGTAIGGLTGGQDYYVKEISGDTFKLGTSSGSSTTVDIIARKTGSFNAKSGVTLASNTITFSAPHTLSNNDEVTYTTNSGTAIGGLTNGASYFLKDTGNGNTFELALTSGGATIVLSPEQKTFNAQSHVSSASDRIYMSHKFSNNDIVTYSAEGGTEISGLTEGQSYYVVNSVSGSSLQLSNSSGGSVINITAGSSETHKLTGQNSGSELETHQFNGAYAGENETHTFTNQYAGPSESHSFTSTQHASASQNHTIKGHTATATAVEGEDDVADPVYYNDRTQDYERAALMVGTVSMTSPHRIRMHSDHETEKLGFYGDTFNYDATSQATGASLPPSKTVHDVDLRTRELARKSMDYINAGIDKFLEVSNNISVNATRLGYSVGNTINLLGHSEAAKGDLLDVDYAIETTTFAVSSMVKETSVALLAQANAPQQAVSTLVGNVMQSQWDPTFFLVQGGGYRYKNI